MLTQSWKQLISTPEQTSLQWTYLLLSWIQGLQPRQAVESGPKKKALSDTFAFAAGLFQQDDFYNLSDTACGCN